MAWEGKINVTEPNSKFPYRLIETNGFTEPRNLINNLNNQYFKKEYPPTIITCKNKNSAKIVAKHLQEVLGINSQKIQIAHFKSKLLWKGKIPVNEYSKEKKLIVAFTNNADTAHSVINRFLLYYSLLIAIVLFSLIYSQNFCFNGGNEMLCLLMLPFTITTLSLANLLLLSDDKIFNSPLFILSLALVVGLTIPVFILQISMIGSIISAVAGGLIYIMLVSFSTKEETVVYYKIPDSNYPQDVMSIHY